MFTPITDRAANASLLGYHYQLDKALIELLKSTDLNAEVTIEGLEDVDVFTEDLYQAIQCKYYEAQKGTPSKLREPIQMMLLGFTKDPNKKWSFVLYAHFGRPSKISSLSLAALKSLLTYKKKGVVHRFYEDEKFGDPHLQKFLDCFRIEIGPSHENQQKVVHKAIQDRFSCTPTEASNLFYPKALALALRLATRHTSDERTVIRSAFMEQVKQASTSIVTPWLVRLLGVERAYQFVHKSLKHSQTFRTTVPRSIVIDWNERCAAGLVQISLVEFIEKLASHSFAIGRSLCNATPWTVIVDTNAEFLISIKRMLIAKNVVFNDGFEEIDFSPRHFADAPVVNRHVVKGKSTDKLGRASYCIRLARFSTVAPFLNEIALGDVLLCVSDPDVQQKVMAACGTHVNVGDQWSRNQILTLVMR